MFQDQVIAEGSGDDLEIFENENGDKSSTSSRESSGECSSSKIEESVRGVWIPPEARQQRPESFGKKYTAAGALLLVVVILLGFGGYRFFSKTEAKTQL